YHVRRRLVLLFEAPGGGARPGLSLRRANGALSGCVDGRKSLGTRTGAHRGRGRGRPSLGRRELSPDVGGTGTTTWRRCCRCRSCRLVMDRASPRTAVFGTASVRTYPEVGRHARARA